MSLQVLKRRWRTLVAAAVILGIFAALLALDLTSHGSAWRLFWSLTGEESPVAQVRGMVEWAGNSIRPQPRTAPMTAVQHTGANPYGINTFLQLEVEPEKRERILRMIAEAGFTWIRQQFPWEDIEIHGRGDFEDRRNDLNGDGQPDAISAWAKYDQIVALAEQYGIQVFVRLDNPPAWTHSANPDIGTFAPPDDLQDFVNYAAATAQRYKGRIRYYQIWNEPNIYPEWGNRPVNPEAYTEMLCRTYSALKEVDPEIVVVSAPLSPTVSLSPENLNDFVFLQRMYDAGAADCFDIMSTQGYGFYSGPTDRRLRPMTLTFARQLYIRDIMVANGDAEKPIWISEAAWNAQPEDPTIVQVQYGSFGIVSEEQAARYMPLAYQRAQEEWPWVGVIFYWFFKRPADDERSQAFYYFRMAEPDFTPLPVYDAMKDYITSQQPVLYPGVHPATHWAVETPDDALLHPTSGENSFDQQVETREITFRAYGTQVIVQGAGEPPSMIEIDGQRSEIAHIPGSPGEYQSTIARSLLPQTHHLRMFAPEEQQFSVSSITVLDRSYENIFPLAAGIFIVLGMLAWVVISRLRARAR